MCYPFSADVICGSPPPSLSTHVSGGIHDELPLDGAHAVLLVLRVQLVAGDHERVHVGDGAAGGQDAVASLVCYSVVS